MISRTLIDTGPLVAHLDTADHANDWARDVLRSQTGPLCTCEAVITETCFLLQRHHEAIDVLLRRVEEGQLQLEPLGAEAASIRALMRKYRSVPMSYADACLVRLTELYPSSRLVTLDSDFHIYRRNGRQVIPLITPRAKPR